jgi:hypothetical protein
MRHSTRKDFEKMGNDTFAAAIGAIVESHKKLYDLLLTAFESYKSRTLPPRTKRVSRILDCEANGAHTILENLATAIKALPRGSLGAEPDLLIAECRDFLDFLEDNLNSPECAAAINDIRQTEEAFVNLIKGLSGCDPNITTEEYHKRIDKFIHELKNYFRNLGNAIVKYEFTLSDRAKTISEKLQNSIIIDKKCEKKIKTIYETVALGKEPSTSEIAAETRHQQILFGVAQYKPRSKYNKGVSFMVAAKSAIFAPQFKDIEGGYKMAEIKSLARAIGREYKNPKLDFAT